MVKRCHRLGEEIEVAWPISLMTQLHASRHVHLKTLDLRKQTFAPVFVIVLVKSPIRITFNQSSIFSNKLIA